MLLCTTRNDGLSVCALHCFVDTRAVPVRKEKGYPKGQVSAAVQVAVTSA